MGMVCSQDGCNHPGTHSHVSGPYFCIFIPKSTVLGIVVGWFFIIIFPLPFLFPGDGSVVH